MIFGLNPSKKVIRDRLPVAELPADVSEINTGNETYSTRFLFRRLAQGAQESSHGWRFFRRSLVHPVSYTHLTLPTIYSV